MLVMFVQRGASAWVLCYECGISTCVVHYVCGGLAVDKLVHAIGVVTLTHSNNRIMFFV